MSPKQLRLWIKGESAQTPQALVYKTGQPQAQARRLRLSDPGLESWEVQCPLQAKKRHACQQSLDRSDMEATRRSCLLCRVVTSLSPLTVGAPRWNWHKGHIISTAAGSKHRFDHDNTFDVCDHTVVCLTISKRSPDAAVQLQLMRS